MSYDKTFGDGRQRIRTVGSMVVVEGPAPGSDRAEDPAYGTAVSCTFDATQFRSANIEQGFGKLSVQVGNDGTGVWFGASHDVAFSLEDLLEAVAAAKAGA